MIISSTIIQAAQATLAYESVPEDDNDFGQYLATLGIGYHGFSDFIDKCNVFADQPDPIAATAMAAFLVGIYSQRLAESLNSDPLMAEVLREASSLNTDYDVGHTLVTEMADMLQVMYGQTITDNIDGLDLASRLLAKAEENGDDDIAESVRRMLSTQQEPDSEEDPDEGADSKSPDPVA